MFTRTVNLSFFKDLILLLLHSTKLTLPNTSSLPGSVLGFMSDVLISKPKILVFWSLIQ